MINKVQLTCNWQLRYHLVMRWNKIDSKIEMKELGRTTQMNIHSTRSLIRTSHACLGHLAVVPGDFPAEVWEKYVCKTFKLKCDINFFEITLHPHRCLLENFPFIFGGCSWYSFGVMMIFILFIVINLFQ